MARTVRDAKLESPTARAKVKVSGVPHWRALDHGLHLGYRKSKNGGRWVMRVYRGAQHYEVTSLDALPDDNNPPMAAPC
jgi:hypothetical protein